MTDKAKQSLAWAAAAVWMVVIFLLSAQTNKESGDLSGAIFGMVVFALCAYVIKKIKSRGVMK